MANKKNAQSGLTVKQVEAIIKKATAQELELFAKQLLEQRGVSAELKSALTHYVMYYAGQINERLFKELETINVKQVEEKTNVE